MGMSTAAPPSLLPRKKLRTALRARKAYSRDLTPLRSPACQLRYFRVVVTPLALIARALGGRRAFEASSSISASTGR